MNYQAMHETLNRNGFFKEIEDPTPEDETTDIITDVEYGLTHLNIDAKFSALMGLEGYYLLETNEEGLKKFLDILTKDERFYDIFQNNRHVCEDSKVKITLNLQSLGGERREGGSGNFFWSYDFRILGSNVRNDANYTAREIAWILDTEVQKRKKVVKEEIENASWV